MADDIRRADQNEVTIGLSRGNLERHCSLINAHIIHLHLSGKNGARIDGTNGRITNVVAPHGQIHKDEEGRVERGWIGGSADRSPPTGLCFIEVTVNREADGIGFPLDRKSTRLNSSHANISYA